MKNKDTTTSTKRNSLIAIVAAIVVAVVGYLLITAHAAGPFASVATETSSVTAPAQLTTTAGSVGGQVLQFSTGTTTPPVATCNTTYPNPTCTGVPAGTKFTKTVNGDYTASTNGEVIDSWHITGNIILSASNVQIKNTQIDGNITNEGPTGGVYKNASFTVADTTIGTTTCNRDGQPSINGHDFTATRVLLQGHADGIDVIGNNVNVQDSYIHPCFLPASIVGSDGYHTDSIQDQCNTEITSYCAHITLTHTTFDSNVTNGNSAANLGSNADGNALADVTLRNNLFLGGGYTTALIWDGNGDKANWIVADNAWVNKTWAYGPIDTETTCSHQTWSGNKIVTVDSNYNVTSTISTADCVN